MAGHSRLLIATPTKRCSSSRSRTNFYVGPRTRGPDVWCPGAACCALNFKLKQQQSETLMAAARDLFITGLKNAHAMEGQGARQGQVTSLSAHRTIAAQDTLNKS